MIGVGSVVGKYVVRAKIGEGAMGTVYLAQHTVLDSRVAVKVIRRDGSETEEDVSRFFTEARAASRIGHENIISVLDVGRTDDGDPFYIMELLTGESLAQRLARGRRPLSEVLHVALQIAGALGASHQKGIVHRDLKPANVLLIRRGEDASFVKVLDFGVAKLIGVEESSASPSHRTQTGRLLGTPHYMAPEQVAGRRAVDGRADVYALGVMLFEMVCGRLPFDAGKWTEVLIQHVTQAPPRAREVNPDCPPWLDRLIDKALAKSASERPTMAAMRDAIRLADGGDIIVPPGEPTEPPLEGGDTLPTPATAETLVEAKPPSNPTPRALMRPSQERAIANADTMVSTDPRAAEGAVARLQARGRRRVLVAAGTGTAVGAGALIGLFVWLGGADAGPPRPSGDDDVVEAKMDAAPGSKADALLERRLLLQAKRVVAQLELQEIPTSVPVPPELPGPVSSHQPRPHDDWVVYDAGPRPPGKRLDGFDVEQALRPTHDSVRYCRNRYDSDLEILRVTITVRGDGSVVEVAVPMSHTGTPLHTCVTRAILMEASFPVFLSDSQVVVYEYGLLPM